MVTGLDFRRRPWKGRSKRERIDGLGKAMLQDKQRVTNFHFLTLIVLLLYGVFISVMHLCNVVLGKKTILLLNLFSASFRVYS